MVDGRTIIICKDCKKKSRLQAKGLCPNCYKRFWRKTAVRKKVKCPECKRLRPHHAKGFCKVCYTKLFRYDNHLDLVRRREVKRSFNLTLEEYKKLTKKCVLCGFDKIIHLHHIDGKKGNKHKKNFIALCPNHHCMAHKREYKKEIEEKILKILNRKT